MSSAVPAAATVAYVRDGAPNQAMLDALRNAEPAIAFEPVELIDPSVRTDVRAAVLDGIDVDQVASLPSLEMVQTTWAGVEAVLAAVPDHVHVVRMIDPQLGATMAEAALTWVLFLHRDGPAYARQQRGRAWVEHPQVHASDRRIGILGMGALGVETATTLLAAGFDVAGWSRSPKSLPGVASFHGPDGLDACLERSDVVVNLLPHTPDTVGLLDAASLARLPDRAAFVNLGRASVVADEDLLAALDGPMSHAVLDVFHVEPLPADHPFWGRDDITVLPHIAANTTPATAGVIAARNVAGYLRDGSLPADALVDRTRGY